MQNNTIFYLLYYYMSTPQLNDPTRRWYITSEKISTPTTGNDLTLDASSVTMSGHIKSSGSSYSRYFKVSKGTFSEGDICGIDSSGNLTDNFNESKAFGVITTLSKSIVVNNFLNDASVQDEYQNKKPITCN